MIDRKLRKLTLKSLPNRCKYSNGTPYDRNFFVFRLRVYVVKEIRRRTTRKVAISNSKSFQVKLYFLIIKLSRDQKNNQKIETIGKIFQRVIVVRTMFARLNVSVTNMPAIFCLFFSPYIVCCMRPRLVNWELNFPRAMFHPVYIINVLKSSGTLTVRNALIRMSLF